MASLRLRSFFPATLLVLAGVTSTPPLSLTDDGAALRARAERVTIVRDDWGIAHVRGPTDADAVFGMAYAQAEDDFNRVETNYVEDLGRLAEGKGASAIYSDLRAKLFIDPNDLERKYRASPGWLRALMEGWADGLNFYLASHPNVHPRVITHFEPWMTLSFSDGTIGPDIEDVDLSQLRAFYGFGRISKSTAPEHPSRLGRFGSNGIAIAPKNTVHGHALLLINPHTTFFFRSELQISSDEGLNAYGAVTWGQFFIYQGFNAHAGWMHTSSGVDNVDQYAETIVRRDGRLYYRYGGELRPVTVSRIVVPYRTAGGSLARKTFTVYRTRHGPIVATENGRWIAEKLMYRPVEALESGFLRTKATDYASFYRIAQLRANSSNNTIFADDKGEIAFMMTEFVARRDDRFDYTKPVNGSNPASDWHGMLSLDEEPDVVNPSTGWVFNTNDWPYSAAGPASPKRSRYPKYLDTAGEDARGVHVTLLLTGRHDFTLEGLRALAFDRDLPFFRSLVPSLVRAYDALPPTGALKRQLAGPIDAMRSWDYRWSNESIPTALAAFWAKELSHEAGSVDLKVLLGTTAERKLKSFAIAVSRISAGFGTWRTPWGQINRFQRLTDDIKPRFDDAAASIPVPFVAGDWGSLAAFNVASGTQTKRWYGNDGNTFVAVVEFGKRVRAIAVSPGGESGDPRSPHFDDQAVRYSTGSLRPVYFYPDELAGHVERTYHPGE
ncbi:MAG TPA: penicillin acylase family protein [Candidatus Binatia bacterium]|nr:penicillin acylase family protein [Candidatus Binatia bacterium]